MSKGKEHKKYEFGSKVSIITTKTTGASCEPLKKQKLRNGFKRRGCDRTKNRTLKTRPSLIP